MNVSVDGAQTLFTIGSVRITETYISLIVVTLLLAVAGILLGRNLTKRPGKMQVITEKGVTMMRNLVVGTMGEHNARWTAYIGTIFLSSIFGSLISLTGFLRSTTADLSVVLTWSVMTTAIIWYQSIKRQGFGGWLKGFTEPIVVMTPMNIVSEIAQPIAMAFRHFGNVAGGGIISGIVYSALALASNALIGLISKTALIGIVMVGLGVLLLIFSKKKVLKVVFGILLIVLGVLGTLQSFEILSGVPILQFGIPAVLSLYFDLFSGFVQAFVFSLLSMVYISGACPPPSDNSK